MISTLWTEKGEDPLSLFGRHAVRELGSQAEPQLTSGRLRDQWHCMSRTGKVARLYNHVEEPRIEMAVTDMEKRAVADGDFVRVRSRRGEIVLRACASEEIRPGQCFVSMHWGRGVLSSGGVNALTLKAFDPYSRQPELKHAAVQVARAELPFQALLMRCETDPERAAGLALERRAALVPWLERFEYASLSLVGRDHPAVVLRIAHDRPVPEAWLGELDALLGLDGEDCLSYTDVKRGVGKRARIEHGLLVGLRLTGETAASGWLRDVMSERLPTTELRRWLLAPLAAPPTAARGRGRIVCNCLDVSEDEIAGAIAGDGGGCCDLRALQDKLKCGTSCGSCVPELKRMLATGRTAA